ncbi:MAG: hypothetical protein LC774_13835 [Acidobacteria bacterium]|nr:hypothetical protein [Acidobacteriota bacterium]
MSDKTCPLCGAVKDVAEDECPRCGGVGLVGAGGGANDRDEHDRDDEAHLSRRGRVELSEREEIDGLTVWKGAAAGLLTGVGFGLGGFFLLRDNTGSMGSVLFLLLPAVAGFAAAAATPRAKVVAASLVTALGLCLIILLISGAEGVVCVLMALPLIAAGVAIGALCGYLFRKHVILESRSPRTFELSILALAPLLLIGADAAEQPYRRVVREETFVTTVALDAPTEAVALVDEARHHGIDAARPALAEVQKRRLRAAARGREPHAPLPSDDHHLAPPPRLVLATAGEHGRAGGARLPVRRPRREVR